MVMFIIACKNTFQYMAWKGGVKTRLLIKRETSFSETKRKFRLCVARDRKAQAAIIVFLLFLGVLASSLAFLPTSSYTKDSPLQVSYSMDAHMNHHFVVAFDVPKGAYVNASYSLPDAVSSYVVTTQSYNIFGVGPTKVQENKSLTGTGSVSYHDTSGPQTVKVVMNVTSGSSFTTFGFSFTATSFYTENVNPLLYASAIWILAAFAVLTAFIITDVFRDPVAYWLRLQGGIDIDMGKKKFKEVSLTELGRNRGHLPAWIWFVAGVATMSGVVLNVDDSTGVIVLNLFLIIIAYGLMKFALLMWVVNRDTTDA